MAAVIVFEERFNVETATPEEYRRFIEKIRTNLHDGLLSSNLRFLPLLPLQPPHDVRPTRFFDIILETNNPDRSITMRLRADNIYGVGYLNQTTGQWYEFQNPNFPYLIPGSDYLTGINITYETSFLQSLPLGQQSFLSAVYQLSSPGTPPDNDTRKKWLFTLVLMICESVRFRRICNHLVDNFVGGISAPTDEMIYLVRNWDYFSGVLRGANAAPNNHYQFPENDHGLTTAINLAPLLGIVLNCVNRGAFRDISDDDLFGRDGLSPATHRILDLEHHILGDLSRALKNTNQIYPNVLNIVAASQLVAVLGISLLQGCMNRGASTRGGVMDVGQCSGGRPLVEVYSVRILNIDNENPGDLYGTIKVTDALTTQYIFNRSRDNIQSIRPYEFALLTGPARSIVGNGSFTIDMDLWDRDKDLSPDDEVSKGQISWEVNNTNNVYDDPIYHDVPGKYGSAQVNYIVFRDAVQATVEVILINGDKENPADIFGHLAARNSNFTNESVLFQRSSGEYVDVRPGNLIPLSRSVVAVPLNSSLIVRADIWDYDTIGSNDEVAVGTVDFPAHLSGTFEKPVYGKYGEIRVKVTWST